jgi:hypothetical protein
MADTKQGFHANQPSDDSSLLLATGFLQRDFYRPEILFTKDPVTLLLVVTGSWFLLSTSKWICDSVGAPDNEAQDRIILTGALIYG